MTPKAERLKAEVAALVDRGCNARQIATTTASRDPRNLHLQGWFFMPPAVKAATLWSIAATATCVLAGLRVWQAMTANDDEIGD